MVKISAVVLVGNDFEPYEKYSIASIVDIVDEIVRVSPMTQKGDNFGVWRNQAVEQAKGEFILCLDSDEVLANFDGSPVKREQLEELIRQANENHFYGYHIFTLHFLYNYKMIDGSNNGNHVSYARFFRKKDFVRYKGKIHEIPEFKDGQNLFSTNKFAIWHFGHCKGMEDLREKYRKRMNIEGNPFFPAELKKKYKNVDEYCKDHPIFNMTKPIIFYNGPLPKVMGLF